VSAASHGAGCGVVLGIVLVIFLQQISYLTLSDLSPTIEYLVIGAVVGGVLGALIGWVLGRRYLSHHALTEATAPKQP
jgi:tetrahydromethanopterin S-methyltransferase subunit C